VSILDFFPPQFTADPEQIDMLLQVEAAWDYNDVIVVDASVGSGKSLVAMTILHWQNCGSLIVPDNMLLTQILDDFPETARLRAKDQYFCIKADAEARHLCTTQAKVRKCGGGQCMKCPMARDVIKDRAASISAYTYYAYYANRRYRNILIADEAHKLISFLRELHTKSIWRHKTHWPDVDPMSVEMQQWVAGRVEGNSGIDALAAIYKSKTSTEIVYRTTDTFNGDEQQVLRIVPTMGLGTAIWPPDRVSKIVLLSATISDIDLAQLGLWGKRVTKITGISSIPGKSRPVIFENVARVTYENRDTTVPMLAQRIQELADSKGNEGRGLVHLPYSMVPYMKKVLKGPRYMWHDQETRKDVFNEFLKTEGAILMGSGFAEGISLNYDKARWQIITKAAFPSKADPFVVAMEKAWPAWYMNQMITTLMQSYGRVCRRPDDYGRTYILDTMAYDTWTEHKSQFPDWFNEGDIWVRDESTTDGYTKVS